MPKVQAMFSTADEPTLAGPLKSVSYSQESAHGFIAACVSNSDHKYHIANTGTSDDSAARFSMRRLLEVAVEANTGSASGPASASAEVRAVFVTGVHFAERHDDRAPQERRDDHEHDHLPDRPSWLPQARDDSDDEADHEPERYVDEQRHRVRLGEGVDAFRGGVRHDRRHGKDAAGDDPPREGFDASESGRPRGGRYGGRLDGMRRGR
jgi:hypothetical protein